MYILFYLNPSYQITNIKFPLFLRWLLIERIDPYLIVVYANVFLIIIGVLLMILALLADMLDRNRKLQEDVLYRLKKQELEKNMNRKKE